MPRPSTAVLFMFASALFAWTDRAASQNVPAPAQAASNPSVAPPPGSAAAANLDRTTPVNRPVPALTEAVRTLAHTIAGYQGQLGVAIVDVQTGELLAAANDRRPLNPASNAKLFTAATALTFLHPNYRFETGLYGEERGNSVARLVLRGDGDPSLSTHDLLAMVRELKERGVKKVDGDVLVDQRFFDDNFVPPAFEQQPNEWAYFRAPVSAVALDENTVTMNVRAGTENGAAAVSFDPPGFVDADGTVKTVAKDRPQAVTLQLAPNGARLSAHLGGNIPEGSKPISFTRRADNPGLLAGYALKALLANAGIAVGGEVKLGGEQTKTLLVLHHSAPLSELLYELGKQSNNFYAEMVLKAMAAEKKGRPGKSADGADLVVKYLGEIGALDEGTVIKNGSGLFDANRVSAATTAKLLVAAYRDPSISAEYVAQLAVGGVDGTLHGRFRQYRARRAVRAKTGTLESAAALSGYVLGPPGRGTVAFSILVNNVAGKVSGTRVAIDQCVDAIVRHLWGATN